MPHASDDAATMTVLSPMTGWLWPLGRTPDAAFAQGLLGPGVAIDPLASSVVAPVAGTVSTFNASHHAIVLRHASGFEVLVHVGIDTVALASKGFAPRVKEGDVVAAGDLLLECDLDLVASTGKSLVSPVIIVAPGHVAITPVAGSGPIAAGDPLFRVSLVGNGESVGDAGVPVFADVSIGLEHGVHARPAAAIARMARENGLSGTLSEGEGSADITSVVALMRMGLAYGDRATVCLRGAEAQAVLPRLLALLEGDFAETGRPVAAPFLPVAAVAPGRLAGLCGSPGLAIGPAFLQRARSYAFPERGDGIECELARLDEALSAGLASLASVGTTTANEVFAAHRELLLDPELRTRADIAIRTGASAGHAWDSAARQLAAEFALAGGWLAERQADLRDVADRVLSALGAAREDFAMAGPGTVVVADDMMPSELAAHARQGVAAIALAGSSPTAHVAIIAAGLGLPLLTGLGAALADLADGTMLLLDATAGTLSIDPPPDELAAAHGRIARQAEDAARAMAAANAPAITRDGTAIAVQANLGGVEDAVTAARHGADGCGLLRTEFLFLDRDEPPSEDEQVERYRAIIAALDAKPLTIRTLDIGGDKPARFLPALHEANPALGVRGIRVSLARPDLLAAQLRATFRAADASRVDVMVPMIADIGEWRQVRAAADAAGRPPNVRLGMMIETPAAVLLADQLAREADFLSIGTNDLTQYILAMDRTNEALAAAADPLHPAVLRAIAQICAAAMAVECPVSVCGGLAAEPLAVPLLLGLGVTRLSVAPGLVPAVKQCVRSVDVLAGAALANAALALSTAAEVRSFLRENAR